MDKENPIFYAERMKFIVATMTKDYEKAIEIGQKILKTEPGDTMIKKYLSALKNRKLIHHDTDTTDSESEISDDSTTNDNVISDSESDTGCKETENKKKGQFYSDKVCQNLDCEKNVKSSCSTGYDEITKKSYLLKDLKGKIIRVLPIRLTYDKINGNN